MSVLFGMANLWCEIILVNDQHKTDRGQYFSVAINPAFTVIESEGGDPINLSAVSIGRASRRGQPGRRSSVARPCRPAAVLLLGLGHGSGLCPRGGCPISGCSLTRGDTMQWESSVCRTRRGWKGAGSFYPLQVPRGKG